MGNREDDVAGPYILWLDYGSYENWSPRSFKTLKEALLAERFSSPFVITKIVDVEVAEKPDGQ